MNHVASELILLNTRDNVAVARTALPRGRVIRVHALTCTSDIPAGHKVALSPIAKDDPVYKYGALIGYAAQGIQKGDHVHSHNLYMKDVSREYSVGTDMVDTHFTDPSDRPTFEGYVRENGRVGTRNFVGVLSTVNCSASVGLGGNRLSVDPVSVSKGHLGRVLTKQSTNMVQKGPFSIQKRTSCVSLDRFLSVVGRFRDQGEARVWPMAGASSGKTSKASRALYSKRMNPPVLAVRVTLI